MQNLYALTFLLAFSASQTGWCDVEGNIYITRHGKGTVVKLSPDGTLLREIALPGSKPSNICFGGPDGRTAYVTEVDNTQIVQFRVDQPGLEWQRWRETR